MDVVSKTQNGYVLNIESDKLLSLLTLIKNKDNEDVFEAINTMVDYLDEELEGALKDGKIVLHVELTINDDGLGILVKLLQELNIRDTLITFDISKLGTVVKLVHPKNIPPI